MFLRTLAVSGLVGLLTLTSCKTKPEYYYFEPVPIGSHFDQAMNDEYQRQGLLEEILEEEKARDPDFPVINVHYYFDAGIDNFYADLRNELDFSEKETEAVKKLVKLQKNLYAFTIGNKKGSIVTVMKYCFDMIENRDDLESTVIDHEGKHARDCTLERLKNISDCELELRAYTNQIVQAYKRNRELSGNFTLMITTEFQRYYMTVLLVGSEQSYKTINEVKEAMSIFEKK